MDNLSHCKASARDGVWYEGDERPFLTQAASRNAPETLSVERKETPANLGAPIIEPFSPAVCFAIIVAIGVALWAIIAALVLAILW